jgi:outer membrane immunogenic protein
MKRSAALALLTTVSPLALLVGSPTNAADMGLKAARPAPPPAPVYSWTGCYVGAHVGWGWGQNRYTSGSFSTGGESNFNDTANGSINSSGPLFGGQLGCNYQFAGWQPWSGANWVFGIQGDFAATHFTGTGIDAFDVAFSGDNGETIALKSDWLASVTGRLGVTAFNNQALFYVKGGVAWIHNKWDLTKGEVQDDFNGFGLNNLWDRTRTGWTVGGGAEWTLWSPNWTAFVEYNFYDFNHGSTLQNACSGAPFIGQCIFQEGRQTINAVKVGVNYKWW